MIADNLERHPLPLLNNHQYFVDRTSFRDWLSDNHASQTEIWVCWPDKHTGLPSMTYLESVLEGLCFGWIDGIAKRATPDWVAQRFTPRKPKGRWTELNKERARQLIAANLMTEPGLATLPPLDPKLFRIGDDILAAIKANPKALENMNIMPEAYVRIRIDYIEERRKLTTEFERSLKSFINKTAEGKLYGYFLPEIGIDAGGKEVISLDQLKRQKQT